MSDVPLAIGIDFGGTSVKSGVLYRGNIVDEAERLDPQSFDSASALIERLAELIADLRERHPRIRAVGVGMPGFVDFPTGLVHNLTNVKGWKKILLRDQLADLCQLPVTVENDANCMAYAEWKRGTGRGMKHLICLTLGTGVGGGIIMDNHMIRGANSLAGELGQTSIDYRGVCGTYGNLGALEDYIGNREITANAMKVYAGKGAPRPAEDCTPKALTLAALAGDLIAREIWEEVARKLATALMNCCWLLNPEAIIIGGGIAKAGDLLFAPLEHFLHQQLSPPFKENLRILPARFGNEAGMVGAAALALEQAGYDISDY